MRVIYNPVPSANNKIDGNNKINSNNTVKTKLTEVAVYQQNKTIDINHTLTFLGNKLKESLDTLTLIYTTDTHRNLDKMPNLKAAVDYFKRDDNSSLAIHAGDYGNGKTGLPLQVDFLNKIGFDMATLGNHEFIGGSSKLAEALKSSEFQTIISNLSFPDNNPVSELFKSGKIVESQIREIKGKKYGFIGATTEELNGFSQFLDGITVVNTKNAITNKVKELEKQGINRIVLISHLGYDEDKIMASIPGIDVIVGGHKHLAIPGIKKDINLFESVRPDGSKEPVIILHGGAHNRYLGVSHLVFNNKGILQVESRPDSFMQKLKNFFNVFITKINRVNKNNTLSDNNLYNLIRFKPDSELKAIVYNELSKMSHIANIKTPIEHKWPIWQLHPIGCMIADSVKTLVNSQNDNTPEAEIVLTQSGCIKRGLEKGNIYEEYINDFVIPFKQPIVKTKLQGSDLLEALNHGAACVNNNGHPGILQVSGLKYNIDLNSPKKNRISPENILVQVNNKLVPFDINKTYIVAFDKFLHNGGERYKSLKNAELIKEYQNINNSVALIHYIKNNSNNLKQSIKDFNNRIQIKNQPEEKFSLAKFFEKIGIKKKSDFIICKYNG
ncbi:MAG: 5'-nucleotidase C-terminal domain-containing protein [Cyanobacteriota bacterium]